MREVVWLSASGLRVSTPAILESASTTYQCISAEFPVLDLWMQGPAAALSFGRQLSDRFINTGRASAQAPLKLLGRFARERIVVPKKPCSTSNQPAPSSRYETRCTVHHRPQRSWFTLRPTYRVGVTTTPLHHSVAIVQARADRAQTRGHFAGGRAHDQGADGVPRDADVLRRAEDVDLGVGQADSGARRVLNRELGLSTLSSQTPNATSQVLAPQGLREVGWAVRQNEAQRRHAK